jgi:hypothetical protein
MEVMRKIEASRPVRATDVAFVAVVSAYCLFFNALAVEYLDPLSVRSLGPLALVYHPVEPPLLLVPVFLLVLILLLRLSAVTGVTRAALIAFVGAACANVISSRVWSEGVPDYIVFRHVDVVANTSDVIMAISAATVLGTMVVRGLRRRVT